MTPRRTDTKSRILDVAEQLLQDRGFNGFSYKDIADELGVKNAAVHYHFPTKTDLGVAMIERMRRAFQRWSASVDAEPFDFDARMGRFLRIYESYLLDQNKVCPAGILEAEFNTLPEEMRQVTRAFVMEMHGWLARLLHQGRDAAQCHFEGEPDDQAAVLGCTLQGALQMARACGPERFRAIVAQLRAQLTTPAGTAAGTPQESTQK